ncbi:hypothetical protein A2U01_0111402 [Trifolium medium]|uniref:Uncharacterized protein n=1 Tax=Trifolium medium TaxID=97028 RepID=A0A392VT13_9FABA|nr:hypothetical protein [Trifolium medium]
MDATAWLEQAFGFVFMLDLIPFYIAGVSDGIVMCRGRYMRLGDGNRRVLVEIRDAIRPLME